MERGRATPRPLGLLATLAMMVVLAGCGSGAPQPASRGGVTSQVAGGAKPTPAPILPWRAVALPPAVSAVVATPAREGPITIGPAVSPVNGAFAWVCVPGASGSFQIWRTQDTARTWSLASTLSPGAQLVAPFCTVSPDQGDANGLAVNVNWGGGNGPASSSGSVDYYSADGGVTWTQLPADRWLQQVFTVGATTYALSLDLTTSNSDASLIATNDHFATWQTIATPPEQLSPNDNLWAASAPGELLWSQLNNNVTFSSSDGGATWAPLPTPSAQPFQVTLASWRGDSSGWLICGYTNVPSASGPPTTLYQCSRDLGKTWWDAGGLTDSWTCDHCGAGAQSGTEPCLPDAIASDGSLLAMCGVDPSQDSSGASPPPGLTLSRLAPGAASWVTVGKTPCPYSADVTLAQTGQLWCVFPPAQSANYVLDRLP